jgi:hypothetical protein
LAVEVEAAASTSSSQDEIVRKGTIMPGMRTPAVDAGLNRFRWPAIITTFLVLPFMILEFVNTRPFSEFPQSFPIPLFALMWLLAFSFVFILTRIMWDQSARVRRVPALAAGLGVVVLALIAYAWVGIVVDQMPCFLGVPNCD